jgi:hypothetical protein
LPDPNWFYSSLAQCGAAVVGLLGGVLVTRLQRQIAEASEARRPFVHWRQQLRQAVGQAHLGAGEFERELEDLIARGEESLRRGGEPITVGIRQEFSTHQSGGVVHNNQRVTWELIETQKARHRITRDTHELLGRIASAERVDTLAPLSDRLQEFAARAGSDAGAIISDYPARIQATAEAARKLRTTALPTASVVVLGILCVLCVFGIVIPLGYLSASDAETKFWVLFAFSAALLALLGYIAYQIMELRKIGNTSLSGS